MEKVYEEEIANIFEAERSAREIWEKIEKLYSLEKTLINRFNIKKQFYRLTMDENTTMYTRPS